MLAQFYLERFNRQCKKNITHIPAETIDVLREYDWPGNVRELVNIIERSVIMSGPRGFQLAEKLETYDGVDTQAFPEPDMKKMAGPLAVVERDHILAILRTTSWKIEGINGAASILRMKPSTLRARMKKLNIARP